jgi:L-asparaginase
METNKQASEVHFIMTGGTIDSVYDGTIDTVRPAEMSIIPTFIKSLKLYKSTEFTTVCMKDSRELTLTDLKKIKKTIENSGSSKIIITHGTYTMPDTARYLKVNLKRSDQVIILTAAAIPMQGFTLSDGPFNLGYALANLEIQNPGVYVAMNGKIFDPEKVMKIIKEGRFSSIFQN